MADDPINIVVTDGVSDTVANKLNAIADAADKSTANLDRLKASLASIRGDNLTTLREQANTVTQSIKAELEATNALSAANTNAKTATASLSAEMNNSKAKIDADTAAIKANTDAKKANADAGKVLDTQSGRMFSTHPIAISDGPAAKTDADYAAQMVRHEAAKTAAADAAAIAAAGRTAKAGIAETEAAAESLGVKGVGFFAKFKTAALSAFDGIRDFASGNGSRFKSEAEALAGGAASAGAELEKLSTHSRGSSTAIRELLVLAREGGRGDFTRMAGSASILAGALGLLPIALAAAAVGFLGLYSAQKAWNTPEEQQKLKDYAEGLGLSEKEMRKLTNTTVDANGKMHEHNELMVTYGDILGGVWDTAREYGAQILRNMGLSKNAIENTSQNFLTTAKATFAVFYGYVLTLVDGITGAAKIFYNAFYNMGVVTANALINVYNLAINSVKTVANAAIGAYNAVATRLGGTAVELYDTSNVALLKLTDGTRSLGFSFDVAGNVAKRAGQAMQTMDEIGDRIHKNTLKRTQERINAEANAIKANRNPKKGSTADPKTKDDYLDDENMKLDGQIKLFGMLKDAREVQSQLDAIALEFQKRRMPLNEAELKQFRDKLVLIQNNNKVQADMDKIYQDINGPQQAFNVGQQALNELLKRGNISLVEYNQQLDKMKRTFAEATDPLFKLNEETKLQAAALDLVGDALDHYNNSERVRQAFLAKGIDLTKNATAAQLAEARAATAELNANDRKKYINSTVNNITDPLIADRKFLASKRDFYARINEMEQQGVIKHKEAEQAKAAIDAKYNEIKLAGAESFFSALSGLSASKNQVLAGIGKAAAVADATIKGYQAVQNALATIPPPFNIAAAAAMAAVAGVQVANIIATPTNVGSYWTGGDFIVKGKTGVDQNRISMNVSDGERVTIQTQAQQQAANNNDKGGKGGDTHVHNYFDEASFVGAMDSHAGEKVVMNIIARNKNKVRGMTR